MNRERGEPSPGQLLLRAMRRALPGSALIVVVMLVALVAAPALYVVRPYQFLPLLAYGFLGARVAARSHEDDILPPSPGRAALLVGGGAAATLTLALLVAALALGAALTGLYIAIDPYGRNPDGGAAFIGLFGIALRISGVALLIATLFGLPCACLGAWLTLRTRLTPAASSPVPTIHETPPPPVR